VDQAAESVPVQNAHPGRVAGWMRAPGRRVRLQRPVRPARIVMISVFAQGQPKVPPAGDQHLVQTLVAGTGNPALRDRVRTRRPDRRPDDPYCGCGEYGAAATRPAWLVTPAKPRMALGNIDTAQTYWQIAGCHRYLVLVQDNNNAEAQNPR
jgi:hypothetical protein